MGNQMGKQRYGNIRAGLEKIGMTIELTIEEGSTNVYADLGYADAALMQRKSQLAAEIARAIEVTAPDPAGRRCAAGCRPVQGVAHRSWAVSRRQ